jgi:2-oxoglutarate dehydrogenase E2 component (dihydrolipoamide succinyltransferase)
VDFTTVDGIRRQKKADYERAGARLTYLTFVARACCESLRAYPVLNAALDGDTIVYKKDINLGIAVALDGGLIVPVVKQADTLSAVGAGGAGRQAARIGCEALARAVLALQGAPVTVVTQGGPVRILAASDPQGPTWTGDQGGEATYRLDVTLTAQPG